MFLSKEAREQVEGFPELLDHTMLVEDGVSHLKSGALVSAWEVVGPDMDSMTDTERYYLSSRVASALDLGGDFGVGCDLIRETSTEYTPRVVWPDAVSEVIDEERRSQFTKPGNYWRNRTFFHISYRPVISSKSGLSSWFFSETENEQDTDFASKALERFRVGVDRFERSVGANMQSIRRLRCYERDGETYDDLYRYIRYCVLGEDYPFLLPDVPCFLNQIITGNFVGGKEPRIGHKEIATVVIDGFPKQSFAGILSALRALPFPYRFAQQAEILHTQQAVELHEANRKEWGFKKIPFLARLTKKMDAPVDTVAAGFEAESQQASVDASYRKTVDVHYTGKIIVMDEGPGRSNLREKVRTVVEAMRPFSARVEEENVVASWVSSFPGQMYLDQRQNLITTTNLAHFFPLGSAWCGHKYNPAKKFFPAKTPPLLYCATEASSAFRLHAHTSDVGHMMIGGPVGAGKTTLLGLLMAQWFRFRGGQVFAFDKKRTLYTLTRAMGGDFYDLTPGSRVQLCPLKEIDTPEDQDRAASWLEAILGQSGLAITSVRPGSGVKTSVSDLKWFKPADPVQYVANQTLKHWRFSES